MKKNSTIIIVCFLVICLIVCAYGVLKIYVSSRTKLTYKTIVGQVLQNEYKSAERCNMTDKKDNSNNQIFESDYDSLLKDLREKYKQKLTSLRDEFNEKLKKSAYETLGAEFAMLISERVILLKDFEKTIKKMLLEGGLSSNNEKLIALNNWVKNGDKKDKVFGKSLFRSVITEVEKVNPNLAQKTSQIENVLENNQKQLEECLNSNSDKIKEIEKNIREEMKSEIVKLILQYNIDLKKLRDQFNLPPVKLESPFSNSDDEKAKTVDSDTNNQNADTADIFDDDLFITKTSDSDDLN